MGVAGVVVAGSSTGGGRGGEKMVLGLSRRIEGGGVFEEYGCGVWIRPVMAESEPDRRVGGGGGRVGGRSIEGRGDRVLGGGTSGASRGGGRRAREARPEGFHNPKTESAAARTRAKLARVRAAIYKRKASVGRRIRWAAGVSRGTAAVVEGAAARGRRTRPAGGPPRCWSEGSRSGLWIRWGEAPGAGDVVGGGGAGRRTKKRIRRAA